MARLLEGTGPAAGGKRDVVNPYDASVVTSVDEADATDVDRAVRAARLIGNGLYGVDVKVVNGRAHVIEINDNPNINSGCEDRILKDELYDRLVASFIRRLEHIKEGCTFADALQRTLHVVPRDDFLLELCLAWRKRAEEDAYFVRSLMQARNAAEGQ